jgi:hypothetical protein
MSWGNFSLRFSKDTDRKAIQSELKAAFDSGKSVYFDTDGAIAVSGLTEEEAAQALEYIQRKGLSARTGAPNRVKKMPDLPMK